MSSSSQLYNSVIGLMADLLLPVVGIKFSQSAVAHCLQLGVCLRKFCLHNFVLHPLLFSHAVLFLVLLPRGNTVDGVQPAVLRIELLTH